MNQQWTMYHLRVIAMSDEEKIKLEKIAKDFVSLCKANGLRVEQATYPVSGQRNSAFHGLEWTTPGPGRE